MCIWKISPVDAWKNEHFKCNYLVLYNGFKPAFYLQGVQSQERNLFLFNDLLLIAKERSSSHFKLKDQVGPHPPPPPFRAKDEEDLLEGASTLDKANEILVIKGVGSLVGGY